MCHGTSLQINGDTSSHRQQGVSLEHQNKNRTAPQFTLKTTLARFGKTFRAREADNASAPNGDEKRSRRIFVGRRLIRRRYLLAFFRISATQSQPRLRFCFLCLIRTVFQTRRWTRESSPLVTAGRLC